MKIRAKFSGGRLTIYFIGELDHHGAAQAAGEIDDILEEYLPRDCAVNLSELRFMDSSGIALILRISRAMGRMGGRAWIEDPAPQPLRVIDAGGIERLVPIMAAKEEVRK
jgi:stage II sporulation protein AA (anti-sigma F factor antagonist)